VRKPVQTDIGRGFDETTDIRINGVDWALQVSIENEGEGLRPKKKKTEIGMKVTK
jgi:hypothetical protein